MQKEWLRGGQCRRQSNVHPCKQQSRAHRCMPEHCPENDERSAATSSISLENTHVRMENPEEAALSARRLAVVARRAGKARKHERLFDNNG